MDMFLFTKFPTRDLDKLIQDFEESAGNFSTFYKTMNDEEKKLFKGYLHTLRVEAHSPLIREAEDETSLSPLF